MKKQIIPAIIVKNQKELDESLSKVIDLVEIIQLDIMDGKFVPNESLNFDFKLPKTNCLFEAHLMISEPIKWIEKNHKKVHTILIHFESCTDIYRAIDLARSKNKKVGVVLNPETPINAIKDILDEIDQVLIMTVNPGFYGSSFLPETVNKISDLRKLRPDFDIEVDGGINDKTIGIVDKAGANLFVSGSYIMKSSNVKNAIENLKKIIS